MHEARSNGDTFSIIVFICVTFHTVSHCSLPIASANSMLVFPTFFFFFLFFFDHVFCFDTICSPVGVRNNLAVDYSILSSTSLWGVLHPAFPMVDIVLYRLAVIPTSRVNMTRCIGNPIPGPRIGRSRLGEFELRGRPFDGKMRGPNGD